MEIAAVATWRLFKSFSLEKMCLSFEPVMNGVFQVAARALATYLIPGCVGRGVKLGSEGSSVGGGGGVGGSGVWKLGVQKMGKIKTLKIQIRSAQNVGKVWISRKKILPALFGAI